MKTLTSAITSNEAMVFFSFSFQYFCCFAEAAAMQIQSMALSPFARSITLLYLSCVRALSAVRMFNRQSTRVRRLSFNPINVASPTIDLLPLFLL
jgi:hypothetical protein